MLLCPAGPFSSVPQGWVLLPPSLSRQEGLCRPLLWQGLLRIMNPPLCYHSIAISLEIPGVSGVLLDPTVLPLKPQDEAQTHLDGEIPDHVLHRLAHPLHADGEGAIGALLLGPVVDTFLENKAGLWLWTCTRHPLDV